MRRHVLNFSIAIALLCVATARTQVAQSSASGGVDPFNGRWELVVVPQGQSAPAPAAPSFLIVEVASASATVSAKVIDTIGSPLVTAKIASASLDGGQLAFVVEINGQQSKFLARRVGDHLEGTSSNPTSGVETKWQGRPTTKTALEVPSFNTNQTPDAKAYNDAMSTAQPQRNAALKQFLIDFPASSMKEQATFSLAQSYPTPAERIAGYRKFLGDFPNSARKDSANLQIALAQPMADRTAALQKFIEDFPASRLKDQAEYEITNLIPDPNARQVAQQKFATDHPKSPYASTIYRNTFETLLREKPVNETKLAAAVDGYINAQPAVPAIQAGAMNTIADRLMNTEVLLDRALELIQKAVVLTEKDSPDVRSIYTTTLGEVQFKLKLYDEAGATLKRAVEISGSGGDAEAQLFLGKFYEVKQQDDAAIEAYLKAWQMGAPLDTKASLEALYKKKHGSLDGLKAEFEKINAKLDAEYLEKPKPFDAGHYARPAAKDAAGKVVLAELFTGAECAPCVAADLAFDGLTERYDRETVAVLIYHLHIPGPDPMTNKDTEARASYYGVNATPTAIVDGNALPAGGGSASMAERAFNDYKGKIETRVSSMPLATLAGFKARLDGDNITVTGDATVAFDAGGPAQKAVLHIALVEDSVRYAGSNGVRFHALVVRKLLGSPAGTPLVAGKKAAYSETVSLAGVTAGLDAYLDNYEKSRSQSAAFTFKERVDHLDPRKLLVVAFVQDEKTKDILQSVVIATGK